MEKPYRRFGETSTYCFKCLCHLLCWKKWLLVKCVLCSSVQHLMSPLCVHGLVQRWCINQKYRSSIYYILHNCSTVWITCTHKFFRWRNRGFEKLNSLLKVTRLVSTEPGQGLCVWLQCLCFNCWVLLQPHWCSVHQLVPSHSVLHTLFLWSFSSGYFLPILLNISQLNT